MDIHQLPTGIAWYRKSFTLHGRVVWRGSVGQTLGYNSIGFVPAMGRSVTIGLAGDTHAGDASGDMVEVTDAREQAGRQAAQNRLRLVEVELYAPAGTRDHATSAGN